MRTELKFKSRENDSLRGILNPAPEDWERSLPFMVKVARSCPAPAGVDTRIVATISPTIKRVLLATIEEFFIGLTLRYQVSIVKNMS